MAVRQAKLSELDRGGSEPELSGLIILTGSEIGAANDFGHLLCERSRGYGSKLDDLERATETARDIVAHSSPVAVSRSGEVYDKHVWCWGDGAVSDAVSVADQLDECRVLAFVPDTFGSDAREIADRLAPLTDLDAGLSLRVGPGEDDWVRIDDNLQGVLTGLRIADEMGLRLQRSAVKADVERWCDWDKDGGRAGLGFVWKDGELVPAPDYDEVCACLELVVSGEMSKSKAAAHLETSSRTITRCIEERAERYGLQT